MINVVLGKVTSLPRNKVNFSLDIKVITENANHIKESGMCLYESIR